MTLTIGETNPGSYSDFTRTGEIDLSTAGARELARQDYSAALASHREQLAQDRGITTEALHGLGSNAFLGVQQEV